MADVQSLLKELKVEFGAVSSAVIGRDGMLISGDIPENITSETITIMCATIMGAAVTAHSEMRIGQPKLIRMTSDKHEMLMAGAGRKAIIMTVVPKGVRMDELQAKLLKIVDLIGE